MVLERRLARRSRGDPINLGYVRKVKGVFRKPTVPRRKRRRFGVRTLLRSPGLTVAAIMAIALGVGINVGIFSVLNGLSLRLLSVPRAQELLSVNQIIHFQGRGDRYIHNGANWFSYSEYQDYRDHNHVFTGLVAYEPYIEQTFAN